ASGQAALWPRSRVRAGAISAPRNGRQKAAKVRPIVSGVIPSPHPRASPVVILQKGQSVVSTWPCTNSPPLTGRGAAFLPSLIVRRGGGAKIEVGKIGAVPPDIAGDEGQSRHRGMGADEEVRQDARPAAACLAVG